MGGLEPYSNASGPFTLDGQGTENITVHLLLNLEDLSASLDGSADRSPAQDSDVRCRCHCVIQDQPTVSHTQRLTFVIDQLGLGPIQSPIRNSRCHCATR